MKIVTVIGARPQFIKAAPVSKALKEAGIDEVLVHTGQHYDYGMSQIFFEEMNIPEPNINLGVGSGNHGWQTAQILIGIEKVLMAEKPDYVLVYGDTNSTLAGALAAVKLHIPLAHVEAGLRSFNREMPEEHNRVLTDHCADLLFCPTQTAVDNLAKEGITQGIHLVGDTMYDAVLQFGEIARQRSTILQNLDLQPNSYLLATVHRQANTDNPKNLRDILTAFAEIEEPIIFPIHPRTRQRISELDIVSRSSTINNPQFIDPVGYLDMLILEQSARMILTDSGGIQKEAYFFGVPCITLRSETEWGETVENGWNVLTGTDSVQIINQVHSFAPPLARPALYGNGQAAKLITQTLERRSFG
jgi:UDP-N-acetylglucosamine 2-epimerase